MTARVRQYAIVDLRGKYLPFVFSVMTFQVTGTGGPASWLFCRAGRAVGGHTIPHLPMTTALLNGVKESIRALLVFKVARLGFATATLA